MNMINLKRIGAFLTAGKLWEKPLKQFNRQEIQRLAEAFVEAQEDEPRQGLETTLHQRPGRAGYSVFGAGKVPLVGWWTGYPADVERTRGAGGHRRQIYTKRLPGRNTKTMMDFNSKSQLSDRINRLIDRALEAERQNEKPRAYLGGSRLGVECERALQFEFFNTQKDEGKDFPGRVLRIFARGLWVEDALIRWMRQAGFDLKTEGKDGKQFGFTTLGGLIKGHCDGVLVGGPADFGPYPRLWECKGIQEKDWKALTREKVKKKYPVYYGQMQVYMSYLKLTDNPALFSAVNMNTMEIYWESVPFVPQAAQDLSDKGVRIIQACQARELLPRISQDPTFFKCKWCSWADRCFSTQ